MANTKVKITEPGWETFTGNFGGVEFVNGASEREITEFEMARIAGSVRVVDIATGKQLNDAATLSENIGTVLEPRDEASKISPKAFEDLQKPADAAPAAPGVAKTYTNDELLAIADKNGIAGLRDIAAPLNVKGRAIPELIENILAAQSATVQKVVS